MARKSTLEKGSMKSEWQQLKTNKKAESKIPRPSMSGKKLTKMQDHSEVKHSIREEDPLPSSARTSGIPLEMPIPKRKTSRTKQNLVPRMTVTPI